MKHLYCTVLILGLSLITAKAQEAQQAPIDSTQKLKEITVTFQAKKFTPVTFLELSKEEITAKSVGQEPAFILAETPSVTAYSDAGNMQGYSYFRMRGIDQTRLNMTLDGMPLNEPEDQGAYFSNYPDILSSMSTLQVQRGVGTTKNGNASYGGSVELSSPNLNAPKSFSVSSGYGSFNSFRLNAEYNHGLQHNKGLYVRVSHQQSDGYKHRSANNAQSVFISSGLYDKKANWKLNAMAGNQRNQMAWLGVSEQEIAQDPRTNANAEEDDRFTQAFLQLQNNLILSERQTLSSAVYFTFLDGNYDFDYNNFLGQPSTDEMYNYAFRSNFAGFYSNYTVDYENFIWTSGIHTNLYNRRHTGSERSMGQLYQNTGYKNEFSIFSKGEYTLNKLLFYADLQYRASSFDYLGSTKFDKLTWQFLNPKAGISYAVNPNTVAYYSIGMTGREPTRNDIFGGADDLPADESGEAILASTSPEYVVDQELGIRHSTDKVKLSANLFYMDFKDEIILNGNYGPNGLALTSKVDNSIRAGIELAGSYSLTDKINTSHTSSFTHSRIKEQGITFHPLLTPAVILNQEIAYTTARFSTGLGARYQSKSYIDFANSAVVEDYILLNARASMKLNKWEISLHLNNLTNTRYYNNGYVDYDGTKKLFVQAPTNIFVAVKFSL
ncbi:TonB-dependent receptor [Pontibacter populi]|uniref:TonB-dependent receptor n=1 Tax=Pontibacter populi TaxID=890055 RepID=A0ABV1RXZ4_9BACT